MRVAVVIAYLFIWFWFILAALLASLAIASLAFGYLALVVRTNPTWSFWLSEPFWAPVWSFYYFHHDHWRGPLWFHRAMGRYFYNKGTWLRLSYGESSIAARWPVANKKRKSVMFLLALISASILIASLLRSVSVES